MALWYLDISGTDTHDRAYIPLLLCVQPHIQTLILAADHIHAVPNERIYLDFTFITHNFIFTTKLRLRLSVINMLLNYTLINMATNLSLHVSLSLIVQLLYPLAVSNQQAGQWFSMTAEKYLGMFTLYRF